MSAVFTPVGRPVKSPVPVEDPKLAQALQVYREGVQQEYRGEMRELQRGEKAALPALSADALGADPETLQADVSKAPATETKH